VVSVMLANNETGAIQPVTQIAEAAHGATLNISITRQRGHELLAAAPGVAASTGSACHSGQHTPSPVLTAMGLDEGRALAAVRLSVGRWTTEADTDAAAGQLADAAIRLAEPAGGRAAAAREHGMTPTAGRMP
jgi:cysteine desulfurase